MDDVDEVGIVYPQVAMPAALAVATSKRNVERLRQLQTAGPTLYRVQAIVGSHIPLTGSIGDIVGMASDTGLSVYEPPLSLYLHRGRKDVVFLDLNAKENGTLADISVEIDSDSPVAAFAAARTAVNYFLDVLMRHAWLPLTVVRLDLSVAAEQSPVAHEIQVPFVGEIRIGPIGGIHQHALFAELESLAREGIGSTSPFYRLLCAYRLYEGIHSLRKELRDLCTKFSVQQALPKDTLVDSQLLQAMGLGPIADTKVRTVNDLHGRLKELRNMVAHFLTSGGSGSALHASNGYSYQVFSGAAAVMLHYAVEALRDLFSFFQKHLSAKLSIGSVLPMPGQRATFRPIVRTQTKSQ